MPGATKFANKTTGFSVNLPWRMVSQLLLFITLYTVFILNIFFIADSEIIIVSDIRRKNDIRYFKESYDDKVFTIRLTCPDNIRNERGYIYTQGIDDIESECGLDSYDKWDLVLENDNSLDEQQLVDIIINKFSL